MMMQNNEQDYDDDFLPVEEAATNLYDRVHRYYTLQIDAIGPDEYTVIQELCHYPEDYETHIQLLRDTLKTKEETLKHIEDFLHMYSEFRHPQYCEIFDYAINIIESQPEKAKQAGMQALMKVQSCLEETHGDDVPEQSVHDIPETIPFQIGSQVINVPSYQDPLLVSLYSVCFLAFANRMSFDDSGSCSTNVSSQY